MGRYGDSHIGWLERPAKRVACVLATREAGRGVGKAGVSKNFENYMRSWAAWGDASGIPCPLYPSDPPPHCNSVAITIALQLQGNCKPDTILLAIDLQLPCNCKPDRFAAVASLLLRMLLVAKLLVTACVVEVAKLLPLQVEVALLLPRRCMDAS